MVHPLLRKILDPHLKVESSMINLSRLTAAPKISAHKIKRQREKAFSMGNLNRSEEICLNEIPKDFQKFSWSSVCCKFLASFHICLNFPNILQPLADRHKIWFRHHLLYNDFLVEKRDLHQKRFEKSCCLTYKVHDESVSLHLGLLHLYLKWCCHCFSHFVRAILQEREPN